MLLLCALSSLVIWRLDFRADTGVAIGGHDFIAYWSAYDVTTEGGNPYAEDDLKVSQAREHPRYEAGAQRYWNPPWALLVLAPILELPFELATSVWLVVTVMSAVLVVTTSWRLFGPGDGMPIPPLVIGVSLLFVPLLECIKLGQMGASVAAVALSGLAALRAGRDRLAGVLLGLMIVKPQAVVLFLFVLGIHVLSTRRWEVVRAAVVTVVAVVGSSVLLLPSAWAGWDLSEASPTHWHSGTVAGWLRAFADRGGDAPTWPLIAVPLVALAAALPWALRHRRSVPLSAVPALLAFSILAAPYAWNSDAVLVLPIQVAVIAAVLRREHGARVLGLAVVATQVITVVVRSLPSTGQQHQIVLPIGLLVVALVWQRTQQTQPQPGSFPIAVPAGRE